MLHPLPTTPRLTFRRFTDDDADLLVDLDSDPEVMRYLTGGQPTPRERVLNDILPRWAAARAVDPNRGFFAVFTNSSTTPPTQNPANFVGWFHLKAGHYWPEQIEIGYRLKRAFWNRGYATEGTLAFLEYAFHTLNEPVVIATTLVVNAASRRVMEKCGMTLEREFIEHRWSGDDKRAVKYIIQRENHRAVGSA